jgi:predicted metal-binding membrane protein
MPSRDRSASRPSPLAPQADAAEAWIYRGTLLGLIGGAWAALALLGASAYAPYFSHSGAVGPGALPPVAGALVFVAGWTLMSVAMMLPSSLPLVTVFRTITEGAPALVALLVAGYLATWAVFGFVALVGDGLLHEAVDAWPALAARADLVFPGLLLTAGLFQFSPLKRSCLRQCRSPVGFVVQHWGGGRRGLRAFQLGMRHGLFCIGCCWALMLLMFAVGGLNLGWMLLLGAVMFVEKAVGWGRWVTAPVGVGLTLWGLALLAGAPAPRL